MVFTVNSYAAFDNKSPLKLHKLERRDTHPDDVVISITYTGVCHSDLHVAHDDWKGANYPVVTGHEIVGVVESVGDKVTKHKVGDVVAVGCMVDSCLECEQCKLSHEMFCSKGMTQTYNSPEPRFQGHSTAGGYSEKIVVPEHFTLKVPKALQADGLLSGVAPILCAGITTYSPLRQYKVGKGSKVAIAGLGGLGHMGVKLAKALGAEVTVVSRSHKKDEHAKALGADKVLASSSEEEMQNGAGKFDLVIDTIPFDHDVNQYLSLVKPYGDLCVVGHLGTLEKSLNTIGLIFGNKRLSGSVIGGIEETQELLDLCGEQKIIAEHKVIPMDKINEAWDEMTNGDVANRFILDVKSFREQHASA